MMIIVEQQRCNRHLDNHSMTRPRAWIGALAAACGAACSPALDWREFVPEGSGLSVTFPCNPDRHARAVVVAGVTVRMDMLVCTADGATYALTFVDVVEPARISTALAELRVMAVSNVQGLVPRLSPWLIKGMTANEQARRLAVAGRLPDGSVVLEHAVFFTRGRRVYQATVVGAKPAPQAVEMFLGGLRFPA
jgi:hypothetical protein